MVQILITQEAGTTTETTFVTIFNYLVLSPGVGGAPNRAILGCTRRTVRWRARRGVGKAEVPGEEDSEGNRPKGLTPV